MILSDEAIRLWETAKALNRQAARVSPTAARLPPLIFMTDPESQIDTVLEVRDRVFMQDPLHNITALGVNWLAGFDFEIKVIARIPS